MPKMFPTKSKLLAVLLAFLLMVSPLSTPIWAEETPTTPETPETPVYQNPSLGEAARKLEIIARQKGIPSVILKTIAFVETGWRQFDKNGNVVTNNLGTRPGLGIMQITSYDPKDLELVKKLKYDIDFNIAYGADLLNSKWNMVPKIGDGDKNKLENWYFALWAYNSWSTVNNPNNTAAKGRVSYQEAVIRKAALAYFPGLVTPVQITPIPPELLPLDTLPKKDQTWNTPEPFTLGDLKIGGALEDPNRGSILGKVQRLEGQNRIDSVNQIALMGWPAGAETVILSRADDFPDALAGVPLAKKHNAPILITEPKTLDPAVIQTIETLRPKKVIILGGLGAVSAEVEKRLDAVLSWESTIERIAGQNRYETAALIAKQFPREANIALATGTNYPDALSLASVAASADMPLLLVATDELPQATIEVIRDMTPSKMFVAGGEAVVSDKVLEAASSVAGVPQESVHRLAGANRYETSWRIVETLLPHTEAIYLTTGKDYTDPLAAGALAATQKAALLLVSPEGFDYQSTIETYLQQQSPSTNVHVIGGKDLISEESVLAIQYLLRQI